MTNTDAMTMLIDNTHLYDKYKAKLLVAVAYDANNRVYSLYFAIIK
jgi:hypothetical protein